MSEHAELDWDRALDTAANAPDAPDYSQPIPKGNYLVKVVEAEATTASTGSPMLKLKLEVDDPSSPYNGRWLWTNLVAKADSEVTMRIFVESLAVLGFPQQRLRAEKPKLADVAPRLVGQRVSAAVAVKKYQGEDRNDVKRLRSIQGSGPQQAAPNTPPQAPSPSAPPAPPSPPQAPPSPTTAEDSPVYTPPPAPPAPPSPPAAPSGVDEEPF